MSEGRCPLLLHANHPLKLFSPSPRTYARPSVKLLHEGRLLESFFLNMDNQFLGSALA